MDDFQRELLARMPLGSAALDLFSYVLDERFLDRLFDEHRGLCYERELSFAKLVYLIRDALLCHGGSAQASFEQADEHGELPVAVANAYGKLSRMPPAVSTALLAGGARRLRGLLPDEPGCPLPASVAGFAVVAVDGKKLKNAPKRLKALRGQPGKLLGAKLLVGLDLSTGLAVAMNVELDGERNDVPLVPGLLPRVRAELGGAVILWVADAQFCDLNLPALFTDEGGHFLLRFSKKLSFHPDPRRPAREGVDPRGRRFVQEWGWVGSEKDKRRRYVRRITLYRPGEDEVAVITDLTDEMLYPAADLLEVYLMRWGIERVFQQVTEVFELKSLIGSSPKGGAFQAALCLLLYDMVQVCKAYAAQAAGRKVEEVSGEKLFEDMRHELIAWAKVGDPAFVAARPRPTAGRLRSTLAERIGGAWTRRWVKKVNKKPRPPSRKAKQSGAHTSVWRVLQAHRAGRQEPVRS
jgi:hypothetical protein